MITEGPNFCLGFSLFEATNLKQINGEHVELKNQNFSTMLRWVLIFLVLALIAAIFGFGGIAAAFAGIAEILFYIFLVLLVIALIAGFSRGW